MNTILCFDPGRTTGCGLFINGVLRYASSYVVPPIRSLHDSISCMSVPPIDRIGVVLVEIPRWYPHDTKDVNDLIDLAVIVGDIRGHYLRRGWKVELVAPRTWKGSVPKKIHNRRVLACLSQEELSRVPRRPRAKDVDHNLADAIGLGLWKLGRMR